MSRKWNEAQKPVRCIDCDGYCPEDVCTIGNHAVSDPSHWRYCSAFVERNSQKNSECH